ncbi:DUF6311 domain-containing protein [Flavobacterium sp.]|jgi:hypothetical protein|uniref:DUF6311 domain-containing protein n=1 Tax=Flavobacterium sp. TaxID=239 RepID=UPI0037BF32A4
MIFNRENSSLIDYLVIFIFSIIIYHFAYGVATLDPSNINWLMSVYHDWGQHYLGWAYFREEPWTFPIGNIQNYNYPAGTNIGLTDSIPLLGIFFKLFSFLLGEEFQYFGFWLLLCFFLNGYYSYKIFKLYYDESKIVLFISTFFIIVNPVLLYRGMHPALCGQWLILASLYNYLKNSNLSNVFSINKNQLLILVLSALINPYLFLMVVGFNIIIPFKNYFFDKTLNLKQTIIFPIISIISVLILWYFVGLITLKNDKGLEVIDSYGLYGFNLNNFYNSFGFSSSFTQLKWVSEHQYEGFAYLGLGMMFFILFILFYNLITRKKIKIQTKFYPLIFLVIVITLFSITNKITFNDNIIFEYPTLTIIKRVGNIFRASGRFIWVLYYLIFLFVLISNLTLRVSNKIKITLLVIFLSIQFYDTYNLLTFRSLVNGKYELNKFDKSWLSFTSKFHKIVTYPPFQFEVLNKMDYQDLCYIALKNNIPITSGYVARESGELNKKFSEDLKTNLVSGDLERNVLYITSPKNIEDFYPSIYKNDMSLMFKDGYFLIFKSDFKVPIYQSEIERKKVDFIYKLIKDKIDVKTISKPIFNTNNKIKFYIESLKDEDNIQIQGWAFKNNSKNNSKDSIFIILHNDKKTYISKVRNETRPDISKAYPQGMLDNSGFKSTIFKENLEKGIYILGLAIKSNNTSLVYQLTNPEVKIKVKIDQPIKKINQKLDYNYSAVGNIDGIKVTESKILLRGWSAQKNKISESTKYKVILAGRKNIFEIGDLVPEKRSDVTEGMQDGCNHDNSGFTIEIDKKRIPPDIYKINILVDDKEKIAFKSNSTLKI